jgi:hypothetical protein
MAPQQQQEQQQEHLLHMLVASYWKSWACCQGKRASRLSLPGNQAFLLVLSCLNM